LFTAANNAFGKNYGLLSLLCYTVLSYLLTKGKGDG